MDNAELKRQVEARQDEMVALRRDLHRHPELAFEEQRTAGIIADKMTELGLEVQTGIAKTGVVGMLRGAQPGKTIVVRADIDALPIIEEADNGYQSQQSGVMHACGHDGHVAIGLATAQLLVGQREQLRGNVKFIFQPAEEIVGGAAPMIEQGVMKGVDAAIGLHLWNDAPVGKVGMLIGPSMANVDSITLKVRGRGGHGSQPEKAVDSVMAACQIVTTLQTLVSREISPQDAAVLSFGTINGGFASNIIAPEVVLNGTVRSFVPEVREKMLRRIEEVAVGMGKALRCEVIFEVLYSCPAVVNDREMTEMVRDTATKMLGEQNTLVGKPVMGSDDMALFLREVPGCYFVVGSGRADGQSFPHHHPGFDLEEGSLAVGARMMTKTVLDFLARA